MSQSSTFSVSSHLNQHDWLKTLANTISSVPGVLGVVLGGSQARGTAKPDSDYDLGIYYDKDTLDLSELKRVAAHAHDQKELEYFAPPGEWGPWINGGAWLVVEGKRVDFLLRDYGFVSQIVDESINGKFTIHYQIGHPNAFYSHMLFSEVGVFQILSDPSGKLASLKEKAHPFPPKLKQALLQQFSFESGFTLGLLEKLTERDDPYYLGGLVFRFTSCLNQLLYALNEEYFLNEKGSVALAESFQNVPKNLREKVASFTSTIPPVGNRQQWIDSMRSFYEEVKARCQAHASNLPFPTSNPGE